MTFDCKLSEADKNRCDLIFEDMVQVRVPRAIGIVPHNAFRRLTSSSRRPWASTCLAQNRIGE